VAGCGSVGHRKFLSNVAGAWAWPERGRAAVPAPRPGGDPPFLRRRRRRITRHPSRADQSLSHESIQPRKPQAASHKTPRHAPGGPTRRRRGLASRAPGSRRPRPVSRHPLVGRGRGAGPARDTAARPPASASARSFVLARLEFLGDRPTATPPARSCERAGVGGRWCRSGSR
jgi:hypothetical protein